MKHGRNLERVPSILASTVSAFALVILPTPNAQAEWTALSSNGRWMLAVAAPAQQNASDGSAAIVPSIVRYTGTLPGYAGERLSLEFSIYATPDSGSALWSERQTVAVSSTGTYTVLLGAGSSLALPAAVFAAGEARWLGVRIDNGEEAPRILLTSVPYAMKAADAETVGGLAPGSLVTKADLAQFAQSVVAPVAQAQVQPDGTPAGSGTTNYVPLWTSSTALGNSNIYQSGNNIGIGTITPATTLQIHGDATIGTSPVFPTIPTGSFSINQVSGQYLARYTLLDGSGRLNLYWNAYNDSSTSSNKYYLSGEPATKWNMGGATGLYVAPAGTSGKTIAWNTVFSADTSADLNLANNAMYLKAGGNVGIGTSSPAAKLEVKGTGKFDGLVTFAAGQAFPGAAIVGGNNSFVGNQTVGGSVIATQTMQGSMVEADNYYSLGGSSFIYGSMQLDNAFLGFYGPGPQASITGNSNTGVGGASLQSLSSGYSNSAFGALALQSNTTGYSNTGIGTEALSSNQKGVENTAVGYASLSNSTAYGNTAVGASAAIATTGYYNTAMGVDALQNDLTGVFNTAVGAFAGPDPGSPGLTFATAIGTNATVSQSDSLVLGRTEAGSPGATYVNVGVGTSAPATAMEIAVNAAGAIGPTLTLTNPGGNGASDSIDFKTYLHASTLHSPTARIQAQDDNNYGTDIYFWAKYPGSDSNVLEQTLTIGADGSVDVPGVFSAGTKHFKIDDPMDPANKYLVHASVESSEQMNVYSGNVVTDELGLATVKMPAWFQAENADFRYQLTVIGGRFAQAIVSKEMENNQFTISTNATNVKVSWQITAVRNDAFAKAHPLVVEQAKAEGEQGYYLHPELYGQSPQKQIGYSHTRGTLASPGNPAREAGAHPTN